MRGPGYPLVDAAMRQLNSSGYMHNRLRMVVASFLTKDLGIDWRRGEAYFAQHLNDFDLAANNGGWQWAARAVATPSRTSASSIRSRSRNASTRRPFHPPLSARTRQRSGPVYPRPWMMDASQQSAMRRDRRTRHASPYRGTRRGAARDTRARYAVVKRAAAS